MSLDGTWDANLSFFMPLVRNNQSVSSWWCNGASFILVWEMWCVDGGILACSYKYCSKFWRFFNALYIIRASCKNTKMLSNFGDIFLDAT